MIELHKVKINQSNKKTDLSYLGPSFLMGEIKFRNDCFVFHSSHFLLRSCTTQNLSGLGMTLGEGDG